MLVRNLRFSPATRLFVVVFLLFITFPLGLMQWNAMHSGDTDASLVAVAEGPPIRLFVIVAFDQMRGDYLIRWRDLFRPDGFRRLLDGGAWFQNCHYPYAVTVTGPGHASLSTGCTPAEHGIVDNDWYDRRLGATVYCATSDRYENIPAPAAPDGKRPKGGSPQHLLAKTFGDLLKEKTGGKSKIVSLSFKDRSAILLGGSKSDACYWIDPRTGSFVTSTYYRPGPHEWVRTFNASRFIDRWFRKDWTPLKPELDYSQWCWFPNGQAPAEKPIFRHHLVAPETPKDKTYYDALYNSGHGNEVVMEVAKRAIKAEQLGRRDKPDLLCISFSSNDPVGHKYGPDSPEVLDVTLRSDLIMRDLLAALDAQVGSGRYLLALSSDHGICPLPEVSRSQGRDAGRIAPELLSKQAEEYLSQRFQKPSEKSRWIESTQDPWIYLNNNLCKRQGVELAEVESALAEWLRQQAGVLTVMTRSQLLAGVAADDAIAQRVKRSFHPLRSGDVIVIPKPYYFMLSETAKGTSHGSPHAYDTHVPLVLFGPDVPVGVNNELVAPQAIMPIFAQRLGVTTNNEAQQHFPKSWKTTPIFDVSHMR